MTSRTLYALLVGIDRYLGGVPALNGCGNDIAVVEDLLRTRVADRGEDLRVVRLLDGQATRAAVIDAFRDHLGRAGPDDVALFYYSGHGSQEPAPAEFRHLEPDGLDETLVLHDSRTPGGWDLADKELAGLIGELRGRPHTLVVLDCCHSGSGTRGADAVRRAPSDRRTRPVQTFLFPPATAGLSTPAGERAALGDSGWAIPSGEHVLIAAARSNETAKEVVVDGVARGALSAALQRVLTTGGWSVRYRDLHRQLASSVETTVREQHPQVETTRATALDDPVLGGLLPPVPGSFVATRRGSGWTIDGGRMHGIGAPTDGEVTRLVVLDNAGNRVATASVTAARPGDADIAVEPAAALTPGLPYRAVVVALPLPPLVARLDGDHAALRAALTARDAAGGPAPVRVAAGEEPGDVVVTADGDGYRVTRTGSPTPTAPGPDAAVGVLEHLALWTRTAELHNPASRLPADAVRVVLEPEATPGADEVDGCHRLPYVGDRPRRYTVTVHHDLDRPVWIALLDLTDTFGIYTDAIASGSQQLQPGESQTVRLSAAIPDALWDQGVTEVTDILKVIVSTAPFDPRNLQRDDLDVTAAPTPATGVRAGFDSTLDRLVQRVSTRRAEPDTGTEDLADWLVRDLVVVAVRPRPGATVATDRAVEIAPGVRVAAHPGFAATVRLTSAADATRDLVAAPVPAALADADSEPFALRGVRDAVGEAIVVEVPVGTVTARDPLVIQLDRTLAPDERVLPYAWDGEFYLPLGYSRPAPSGGGTEIVLQRLSEPVATARSLLGSVRILFRKLVGTRIGLPFEYPLLRLATVTADGRIEHRTDVAEIRAAVADASSVVVCVHGILGDTDNIVRALPGRHQVVLAFDYENLDTTIEENARGLAARLQAVGLGADHDKRLDVVAHSMGGLVARHLLEFVGGVRVSRLVTLGTPNGGSPWASVQDWAVGVGALALNSLTAVAWPVGLLGGVLAGVEQVDAALDELDPGSTFLAGLAGGRDPGVPYTAIVGNRSLTDAARAGRLLSRVLGGLVDLAFLNAPNDLCVAVSSARHLPPGRTPAPEIREIACDHVTFFTAEAGLQALSDALPR